MTVDQVLMLLTDRKLLLNRRRNVMPLAMKRDKDGMIPGRAADGTAIRGRITGTSKARRLMEAKGKSSGN